MCGQIYPLITFKPFICENQEEFTVFLCLKFISPSIKVGQSLESGLFDYEIRLLEFHKGGHFVFGIGSPA